MDVEIIMTIKIKIIMIDNYNDLTLEKFYELKDVDTSEGEVSTIVQAISVLSDMDENEILKLPLAKFNEMSKKLEFLHTTPTLLKKMPDKVVINNKKYTVLKDATKMTAGQYIDYKSYAKDFDSLYKNLPLILTTVIIPEGKTYGDGYDTVELAEELKKHISITLAMSISNFFFTQSQTYSKNILIYLEMKMRKMMRKEKDKEVKTKMMEAIKEIHYLKTFLKNGYGLTGLLGLGKYTDAYLKTYSSLELSNT